jgi:hypothetical protein
MNVAVTVDPASVATLSHTLNRYVEVSRKTPEEAMDRQGRELSIYLYQQFLPLVPPQGKIESTAFARGFRLGRRKFGGKLSPESYRLADVALGGNKSVYGRVAHAEGGTGMLRTIRVGTRGKRITGGRFGRGGEAATQEQARLMKTKGEHALNRQALATFYEISKRESGRRYLASSFLLFRKKRNPAALRMAGESYKIVRQSKSHTSFPWMKSAELSSNPDGSKFVLTASADGVEKYPGRIAAGIEATRANMQVYIDRQIAKALAKEAAKGVAK